MPKSTKQAVRAPQFEFLCGTGTLRAKNAQDAVIRDGRISVPHVGQCYINGVHGYPAVSTTLAVARCIDRKVVGHLVIPCSKDYIVEGSLVIGEGAKRETWKVVATTRIGKAGPYRALRLPDVKISQTQKSEAFGDSKYSVA